MSYQGNLDAKSASSPSFSASSTVSGKDFPFVSGRKTIASTAATAVKAPNTIRGIDLW